MFAQLFLDYFYFICHIHIHGVRIRILRSIRCSYCCSTVLRDHGRGCSTRSPSCSQHLPQLRHQQGHLCHAKYTIANQSVNKCCWSHIWAKFVHLQRHQQSAQRLVVRPHCPELRQQRNPQHCLEKNGHILPTGQWYAPSAVHSVILCYTLLNSALLCFTPLYTALLCSTLLYTALLCSTLL